MKKRSLTFPTSFPSSNSNQNSKINDECNEHNECSFDCPGPWLGGENSLEFYRDPVGFFNSKATKFSSDIFFGRFLFKTTTFIGSSSGVNRLLNAKLPCEETCNNCDGEREAFAMGYQEYLAQVYGDIVLFSDGEECQKRRICLSSMLTSVSLKPIISTTVVPIIQYHFDQICDGDSISIYDVFKALASDIMICVFLGINYGDENELLEKVRRLSTAHWHGIISLPVNFKSSLFSSSLNKALDARQELIEIVKHQIEKFKSNDCGSISCGLFSQFCSLDLGSEDSLVDHMILLVTALGPKAIASALTSFVLSSPDWYEDLVNPAGEMSAESLNWVLWEVLRLWPPFIGGRRIALADCVIDGYRIPKDRPVVFLTMSAHRDPKVFTNPEMFDWTRWKEYQEFPGHLLFSFGDGTRRCIGQEFMLKTMKELLRLFLHKFTFVIDNMEAAREYKWLPVSRPKVKPMVTISKR